MAQSLVINWANKMGKCYFYFFVFDEVIPEEGSGIWVGIIVSKYKLLYKIVISFAISN